MSDNFEETFFKLCELKNYNSIKHNLHNWNISFEGWINKAGQIETLLILPYSEMNVETIENSKDTNFFNKSTMRIKLKLDKPDKNYLFSEKIKLTFNEAVEFILLDTPFIYPHNFYYLYNRNYLITKIIFSIEFIKNFIDSYKSIFNNSIPYIYINNSIETYYEYKLELIIKEYLDIYYISTDLEDNTIICNLILNLNFQKEKNIKYKKIILIIPRLIRKNIPKFKILTSNWKKN
jgi:hypothetical protein